MKKRFAVMIAMALMAVAVYSQSASATTTQRGTLVQLRDYLLSPAGQRALSRTGLGEAERRAAITAARQGKFRRCMQERPAWCTVVRRVNIVVLGIPQLLGEVRVNPDFSQDATFVRRDVWRQTVYSLAAVKKPASRVFELRGLATSSERIEEKRFFQHVPPCIGPCAPYSCVASINEPPCIAPLVISIPVSPWSSSSAQGQPGDSCAADDDCHPAGQASGGMGRHRRLGRGGGLSRHA